MSVCECVYISGNQSWAYESYGSTATIDEFNPGTTAAHL